MDSSINKLALLSSQNDIFIKLLWFCIRRRQKEKPPESTKTLPHPQYSDEKTMGKSKKKREIGTFTWIILFSKYLNCYIWYNLNEM